LTWPFAAEAHDFEIPQIWIDHGAKFDDEDVVLIAGALGH
jgi:hypothetical protein